ncbi:MAG: ATPase [Pseudomonadota bacterium]
MIYPTAQDWHQARQKRVTLFGMSGLGKTHVSNMLRDSGEWFHYSIDYRIGTRYMGEFITDNFKREAMKNPFLADLLRTDSIYVGSNITFENLAPLSTYLGKPGDPDRGGLDIAEYARRQEQHHAAEVQALMDTVPFIEKARAIYGYDNFICDTGGSICEVVDPDDPSDPILTALAQHTLMVWIEGSDDHTDELVRRFRKAPKPMCYQLDFLHRAWGDYTAANPGPVDPDDFMTTTYAQAITRRQPRYAAMARWGVSVTAEEVAAVRDPASFDAMIATAIDRASAPA